MGDPGLASKFVEMQQEEKFAPAQKRQRPDPYHGFKLDRARILAQLEKATHPNHRAVLKSALAEIESRIPCKQ